MLTFIDDKGYTRPLFFNLNLKNTVSKMGGMKLNKIFACLLIFAFYFVGCGSSLQSAIENDNLAEVKRLVESGADINKRNLTGRSIAGGYWTPLMIAAYEGNLVIADYLIKEGADINLKAGKKRKVVGSQEYVSEFNGFTALHFAAYYGHAEIAKLLIDSGADLTIQDDKGLTAYDHARKYYFWEIVKYLDKAKANKGT